MGRKSRLYNSLKEGKGRSEVASNFLVKFEDKSDSESDSDSDDGRYGRGRDYPAKDDDEEWVEYTDALGRTRTCMRKDLKRLKRKDKDLSKKEREDSYPERSPSRGEKRG